MSPKLISLGIAAVSVLILLGGAQATVPLTEVIHDPFTNPSSQHATAVEPDTFAHQGKTRTIVAVSQ